MIDQIQPSQLPDWISNKAEHGTTVVLDVREPYEVQTACISANGFELVTLPMGSIVEKLSELDKDRPIACCVTMAVEACKLQPICRAKVLHT